MVQLIVGVKGAGKTKALIAEVNRAARESHGAVVCIEYGRKLTYDIQYQARLVDAKDYDVNDASSLYGFVCGILAANYDVTELFIDSALKICQDDIASFEEFILKLDKITGKNNINCIITASVSPENVPATITSLIRESN
ncbi:MAG: hypothetical protein A2Y15_01505 [Clostridiales bacterium GWF2_36_10]|nr:MAG: hypothetical protein A2Y15_01505 [Clostridiales bacterium GWF2_36_10]HAN22124.1 hypothetical protein [Clostridiales bacterium]